MQTMLQADYISGDFTAELVKAKLESFEASCYLDRVLATDTTMLIVDDPVKRVDNMTMAWGLEARVPFLDHELVELAAKMPPEMKMRDGGKYVLKEISRGLIPDSVIDRPIGYFPVPALKYVGGEFLEFMQDILNSQKCIERGIYQRSYVDKLLAKPDKYLTRIKGSKVWHMALLEFWLQQNGV
jgi:asparagine synthase (glutamine-hydrolysing)